jgi:5-hydroxyisourate hydrolase
MAITTHILDTSIGRPAPGVEVRLEQQLPGGSWQRTLVDSGAAPAAATYRLTFETGQYFRTRSSDSFYPRVIVEFVVRDVTSHYHVPLLVSPFGYSTYRGS